MSDETVPTPDLSGSRILEYRLERKLGEGGMGAVYLGVHETLGQKVAVKVLAPELARHESVRERFIQEARIQMALQHPAIVSLKTASTEGTDLALVMEYVEGRSLEEVLAERGALSLDEALALIRKILPPVAFAHRQGVIHRDLKPGNILVTADGRIKITDFGISKVVGGTRITRTGAVMGSPEYMSPEQVIGSGDVDQRSDVYSLGATFFQMLTGQTPFQGVLGAQGDSDFLLREAHVRREPTDPRALRPDLPEGLAQTLLRSLAKSPDDRPGSADAFWREIEGGSGSTEEVATHDVDAPVDGPAAADPDGAEDRDLPSPAGCSRVATFATAGALLALLAGAAVTGALYWNWARAKTVYCATVVERWGVEQCDTRISAVQQQRRTMTHALTVARGRTLRSDHINGLEVLQDGKEYIYREDGSLERILERNEHDAVVGQWVYAADMSRRDRKQRNGGKTHDVELLEFDDDGYLTRVQYRTDAGGARAVPRYLGRCPDRRGPPAGLGEPRVETFGEHFQRDRQWRIVLRRWLGPDGELVEDRYGVGHTEYRRDAHGAVIEEAQFRADGTPWFGDGGAWAIRKFQRDDAGNRVTESYFDPEGGPIVSTCHFGRCHTLRYVLDDHGLETRIECLGVDGDPMAGSGGYAAEHRSHDGRGRLVERAYFGVDGQPSHDHEGIHREVTEYGDDGLSTTRRDYTRGGELVPDRNDVPERWTRYSTWGDELETRFRDGEGTPVLSTSGVSSVRHRYGDDGDLIETAVFGRDAEPVDGKRSCHRVTHEHDVFGEEILSTYFRVDGEPEPGKGRCAALRRILDEHGREVEWTCLDADGERMNRYWRTASGRSLRDANGQEIETEHYDAEGERRLWQRWRTDDRGRALEFSFLDAKSGNPYVPRAGYATRRYRYDDAGRSIGWSYLDDKGQPLDKQDDAAFHEYTRDARGRLMRVVYLDAAETPRAVAGRFCYERSLDGRGRLVRETNLDSEGNRMLDDSGYAIEETRYDGWDRVVEIRHLGIHEEPVDTSDGWSRKVMEYDEFGEKVSERRYDRLGNEVR